jgi:hypothetical protein
MNEAKQCACGQWFSDTGRGHTTCKPCRNKPVRRPRRLGRRRPVSGSLEWAEQRGGLIGGYETDDTYCPD